MALEAVALEALHPDVPIVGFFTPAAPTPVMTDDEKRTEAYSKEIKQHLDGPNRPKSPKELSLWLDGEAKRIYNEDFLHVVGKRV